MNFAINIFEECFVKLRHYCSEFLISYPSEVGARSKIRHMIEIQKSNRIVNFIHCRLESRSYFIARQSHVTDLAQCNTRVSKCLNIIVNLILYDRVSLRKINVTRNAYRCTYETRSALLRVLPLNKGVKDGNT